MRRATLIMMLSVSWPVLAIAADPALLQSDFEPKPLPSREIRAIPDAPHLRGPEDFILPAPELVPHIRKDAGPQERAPSPQSPSNAPVLEGF